MKRVIILCLALVLSGVLSGCSGMRNRTSADLRHEGALFSNQEAVCLKSDDPARPWRLKWALTEDTWNTGELFLTVHERQSVISPDYDPESTAAIYVKAGGKLKLLKRLEATEHVSYFLKPTVVWAAVKGEDREQLIQITEVYYGTGHFAEEHVFTIVVMPAGDLKFAPDLKLDEVEFVPADASFKEHLAKGEGVWKGVTSTFTDHGLFFDFAIWKDGDGNCCPSAGKVTGAYKLERKPDGGLSISTDTCKREPIKETE
jgi:hypothetical protein